MLKLFRLALAGLALVCAVAANAPAWAQTVASPASTAPTQAPCLGAVGETCEPMVQANAHLALKITTATTTELIPLSGTKVTYITWIRIRSGGTANVNLVYGSGTNCGTGTTDVYPAEPLTASDGFSGGAGLGPVLVIPAGKATCLKSDAAVTVTAIAAYRQR